MHQPESDAAVPGLGGGPVDGGSGPSPSGTPTTTSAPTLFGVGAAVAGRPPPARRPSDPTRPTSSSYSEGHAPRRTTARAGRPGDPGRPAVVRPGGARRAGPFFARTVPRAADGEDIAGPAASRSIPARLTVAGYALRYLRRTRVTAVPTVGRNHRCGRARRRPAPRRGRSRSRTTLRRCAPRRCPHRPGTARRGR